MAEFHGLLTFETSALPESDPEKETLPDAVSIHLFNFRMQRVAL